MPVYDRMVVLVVGDDPAEGKAKQGEALLECAPPPPCFVVASKEPPADKVEGTVYLAIAILDE